jgi:hypothetical protein
MSHSTIHNPKEDPRNSETETEKLETGKDCQYRSPQVITLGKAIDLLQGQTEGKHFDGYTGYWWNSEGG